MWFAFFLHLFPIWYGRWILCMCVCELERERAFGGNNFIHFAWCSFKQNGKCVFLCIYFGLGFRMHTHIHDFMANHFVDVIWLQTHSYTPVPIERAQQQHLRHIHHFCFSQTEHMKTESWWNTYGVCEGVCGRIPLNPIRKLWLCTNALKLFRIKSHKYDKPSTRWEFWLTVFTNARQSSSVRVRVPLKKGHYNNRLVSASTQSKFGRSEVPVIF